MARAWASDPTARLRRTPSTSTPTFRSTHLRFPEPSVLATAHPDPGGTPDTPGSRPHGSTTVAGRGRGRPSSKDNDDHTRWDNPLGRAPIHHRGPRPLAGTYGVGRGSSGGPGYPLGPSHRASHTNRETPAMRHRLATRREEAPVVLAPRATTIPLSWHCPIRSGSRGAWRHDGHTLGARSCGRPAPPDRGLLGRRRTCR